MGSAVEHAAGLIAPDCGLASCPSDRGDKASAAALRFRDLFSEYEAEEEQTSALVSILELLRGRWPYRFRAADVARFLTETEAGIELKSLIEQATGKPIPVVSASALTWQLKALPESPVQCGDRVLTLRRLPSHEAAWFEIAAEIRA